MKLWSGLKMGISENLKDKNKKVVVDEILRIKELIKRYRKLLVAIGKL